ncbi:MAG: cytochrome P460 family protein [Chthoniobacter sp.]|uniref:cytochrome P460 family protein n=1 Tax=Chthoniobacter sp. TaxID=2510640 RepID=UPI0032ADA0CF
MKVPLLWLSAAMVVSAVAAEAPEISDATLRAYPSLHKMTAQARPVAMGFSPLCRPDPQVTAARKASGPHAGNWINVYMNETARNHFESKTAGGYPPGSIVVKEKLSTVSPDMTAAKASAVAGLIKHAPGYNAATGDWEFFYSATGGKMERGTQARLASCADCHQNASADYVFGDFAKPAPNAPAQPVAR